jgi:hypothetical protein
VSVGLTQQQADTAPGTPAPMAQTAAQVPAGAPPAPDAAPAAPETPWPPSQMDKAGG